MAFHIVIVIHLLCRLRVVRSRRDGSIQPSAADLHRDASPFAFADCHRDSLLDFHIHIYDHINTSGDADAESNAKCNCLAHFDSYSIFDSLSHANAYFDSDRHAHSLPNGNTQTL